MTKQDWESWVKYHAVMFGMGEKDIEMVVSWRSAVDAYSLAELKTASVELLRQAPKFRNEHVRGFFAILFQNHAQTQKPKQYGSSCRCQECERRKSGMPEPASTNPATKFSFVQAARAMAKGGA